MVEFLSQFNIVTLGILATVATGFATGIGTLPVFFTRNISKKMMDASLGAAAGIMLAATSFSLIIPAIESAGGGVKGAAVTLIGILLGGIFLDYTDKFFPDTNLMTNSMENSNGNDSENGGDSSLLKNSKLRKVWIFILAITIHNFPEGLAVGVGFGNGDIANGLSLAIAIGLQNMPEGLAVALPMIKEGVPTWKAFSIALATGMVEPVGGLLGVGLVHIAKVFLPLALAFAAGAMLFVISHEIIPESQNHQANSKLATHALLVGFVVMMFLDTTLG